MGGVFGRWRGAAWWVGSALLVSLGGCDNSPWESGAASQNTLFTAMQEGSPRHLDPTASYWSNDTTFTYQIYEPPYGYHYLKRPYQLIGKAAQEVVKPRFYDKDGKQLPDDAPADQVAESVYDVPIKHGILYQPH
ncbi:MAG TPA: peptide ABC transporter substrate-binding protein, partial [Chloroflexota bacterium]